MIHAPRTAVAVALISLFLTGSTLIPEAERRSSEPTGIWNAVAAERMGKDYTRTLLKLQLQWEIDGKTIKIRNQGVERTGYTYTIDPTKKPAHLDMKLITTGRQVFAIYRVEGNRLFICMPVSTLDKQRPTELKGTVEPRTMLYIFERAPKP
jgi:uncharacterized protein (TIGR03067 family)